MITQLRESETDVEGPARSSRWREHRVGRGLEFPQQCLAGPSPGPESDINLGGSELVDLTQVGVARKEHEARPRVDVEDIDGLHVPSGDELRPS